MQTEHASIGGAGSLNLKDGQLHLMLTPRPNAHAWFALDRSIKLSGPVLQARAELVPTPPAAGATQACDATASDFASLR